ncbi:hypothetical protein A2V49_02700 [candidate division WWE3 bacterium RBG_19FT_COMBO_34_6]|uniref:Uncharacterized protein n=1 Tax=candidate division WWE3 bacterium RBG_19FT_COMBO_34_6 TaxID=1802612 RepID=A0A1F4UKV2_UNCKA|nr:MAG: hypothetical protein A2V49_02700 [candidate division WWE3 bacterium RBG_19FT_COMBO_34_6]
MEFIVFDYKIDPKKDAALWLDLQHHVIESGTRWILVLAEVEDKVIAIFRRHKAIITNIHRGNTEK